MMQKNKILWVLFFLNLLFIWVNSALPAEYSMDISNIFTNRVKTMLSISSQPASSNFSDSSAGSTLGKPFEGAFEIESKSAESSNIATGALAGADPTETPVEEPVDMVSVIVRKMAHAIEFFSFGMIAAALLIPKGVLRLLQLQRLALVGLTVPLLDETIQIFSARTAAVQDVWIDIAGFFCGVLVCFAFRAVRAKNKRLPV